MGLSNKSPKLEITPARALSDGGEILKIGLVRQPRIQTKSLFGFGYLQPFHNDDLGTAVRS